MNRHTKLAIFIAPVLIVLGYVGSDFYVEQEAADDKIYQLIPEGSCDILAEKCILKTGDFEVNVFDKKGITTINSTFPLDSATLFLVDSGTKSTAYPLGMSDNAYYWSSPTKLRNNLSSVGDVQRLRLIVKIKGGNYISEFTSQTR